MYDTYVIEKNDTITTISSKFNTSPEVIYQLNGFVIDLKPGNTLVVPRVTSNYFDYYDLVVNKKIDESSLLNIIDKTNDYLTLVKKIFIYIIYQKKTNIPYIEWLIKEY